MTEVLRNRQSGETGAEIVDIQELYRRRGDMAIRAAELPVQEKQAEAGEMAEFPVMNRAESKGRVLIDDKVDRFGNAAYSKKTLENLQKEGEEEDPAETELAEQIEAARSASAEERKAKILEVLNGRSPEFAIAEMRSDIGKWEAEIQQIQAEAPSEGGKMEAEHDQQMIKEMQERIELIESITPEERAKLDYELGTDVIVDTYEDGSTEVREAMPVTTAMADEDFAAEVAKTEGPIEVGDRALRGAASGELEMNSPLDTDEWKIRRQAVEILKGTEGMPEDLVAGIERALRDAEESAVREAKRADGFAETAPEDMKTGPQEEDLEGAARVEPLPTSKIQEMNNSGENQAETVNREELQAQVQEKIRKRPGIRMRMRRAAAMALLTLSTATTVFANSKMTAVAAEADKTGGGSRIEAAIDQGARGVGQIVENTRETLGMSRAESAAARAIELAEAGTAQFTELLGNLETDNRYEAENGTRYRYDEFDSTEKHGKHGFGTDKSEFYNDTEGTREAFLEVNRAQPEVLAATITAYPSILEAAGLDAKMTPYELDDLLSNQDGGGELQAQLLQLLEEKWGDANTQYEFYQEYGQEYSYYMKNKLGDGELSTPENLELGRSLVQRNGEKQVKIGIPVYNEIGTIDHYEFADFNMRCVQRNDEIERKTPRAVERAAQEIATVEETDSTITTTSTESEQPENEQPEGEQPEGEQPEGEQPDPEDPDPEDPDPEDPDPEDPDPEKPAEKNAENEIKNATEGTTGELTQTEQDGEVTEEKTTEEGYQEAVEDSTVKDSTATEEEQAAAAAEQEAANEAAEAATKVGDDELADAVAREQAIAAERAASTGTATSTEAQ